MSVLDEIKGMMKGTPKPEEGVTEQPSTEEDVQSQQPAEPVETSSVPMLAPEGSTEEVLADTVKGAMVEKAKEEKDIKQLAKDLTFMKGASDLQHDDEFVQAYNEELGKQLVQDLKDSGKRAAIAEQAKKLEERNLRNEQFYRGCKPIFDLLGIEASYGLVPMIITVVLLMIPFLVVSLVRFVINSINSVFTAISNFKKPAFWICTILIIMVLTFAVILAVLALIDALFGTQILSTAMEAVA